MIKNYGGVVLEGEIWNIKQAISTVNEQTTRNKQIANFENHDLNYFTSKLITMWKGYKFKFHVYCDKTIKLSEKRNNPCKLLSSILLEASKKKDYCICTSHQIKQ